MLFELMIAVFMEKQTTKNNKNSGKPSSHTGSKKKQRSENDIPFDNARTVETLEVATVDTCEHCGEDLSNVLPQSRERRTKIDIIFEKNVTHIEAEIKTCPDCQMQTKDFFPADMTAPLQYAWLCRISVVGFSSAITGIFKMMEYPHDQFHTTSS